MDIKGLETGLFVVETNEIINVTRSKVVVKKLERLVRMVILITGTIVDMVSEIQIGFLLVQKHLWERWTVELKKK